ncbi:MAG: hypothetical protein ACK5MK_13975 [Dysgonomonas sp.]
MDTGIIKRVKVRFTPSIKLTLMGIPVGETRLIKAKEFKTNVVRTAISKLKAEGYDFTATERGLINEVLVTRNL